MKILLLDSVVTYTCYSDAAEYAGATKWKYGWSPRRNKIYSIVKSFDYLDNKFLLISDGSQEYIIDRCNNKGYFGDIQYYKIIKTIWI